VLSRALVLGVYIAIELELALRIALGGGLAGLRQLALTPQVLLGDERLDLVGVIRLERGAGGIRADLVEREVRADLVLQPQLPLVRLGRMVPPEAAVRDGEARVELAPGSTRVGK
jgi:hypothetical protein